MTLLDKITEKVLAQIDDTGFTQSGAFNLRHNGIALCHGDSEHIKIKKKQDKPGIDIFINGKTDGEEVHIPVVVDASGMTDVVYNDFYVAEGANVTIVAGCGIHNSGCNESRHDGIHTFHVEKNANVRYVEKHYGEGEGTGARVLNPVTEVYLGENSVFTLDTAQIKGVDSTVRENNVHLEAGSKLYVIEKLMTHGKQEATSNMMVELLGEEERKMYADILAENNERLLRLVNDIFDLSQIESGTIDFVYTEFDVNDLLRELDGIFKTKLNNSSVKLICEAHVQPIIMYSERERIIQVLSNLLHNAMKFIESGEIRLGCSLKGTEEVCFVVSDTGIGIKLRINKIWVEILNLIRKLTGDLLSALCCRG